MTKITFKGKPIHTVGNLPQVGSIAPDFTLTQNDLTEAKLSDFKGKKVILNIFPSLDTPTCANAMRKFNEKANQLKNTKILCISADLPFAQSRFCSIEKLQNVIPLSVFRHPEFGKQYGVTIQDSPLAGLLSRAVIIIDETGKVIYTQQVAEIADEPNYENVLQAI